MYSTAVLHSYMGHAHRLFACEAHARMRALAASVNQTKMRTRCSEQRFRLIIAAHLRSRRWRVPCRQVRCAMACPPEVDAMIKSANATGKLVAGWESCCDYLVKKGHAWHSPIHSGKVITFPGNRSGALASQKSHTLGSKIVDAGWSWKKAAAATCVQMPDDPDERQKALEVNEKMSRLSNGKIPMHDDNVQAMAIGGNHTNLFIRGVHKKAPTNIESIRGPDGNIDKDRLISDPGIKDACEQGLRWLIISSTAAKWPGLVGLGQRALNTFASEPQSEIELICRAGACPCCCVQFVLCACSCA